MIESNLQLRGNTIIALSYCTDNMLIQFSFQSYPLLAQQQIHPLMPQSLKVKIKEKKRKKIKKEKEGKNEEGYLGI